MTLELIGAIIFLLLLIGMGAVSLIMLWVTKK